MTGNLARVLLPPKPRSSGGGPALAGSGMPGASSRSSSLPSVWGREAGRKGVQEVARRTAASEAAGIAPVLPCTLGPVFEHSDFHTSADTSPFPLDQPSQTWSFAKELS